MTIPNTTTMLGIRSSEREAAFARALSQRDPPGRISHLGDGRCHLPQGTIDVNAFAASLSADCGSFLPSSAFWISTCSAFDAAL